MENHANEEKSILVRDDLIVGLLAMGRKYKDNFYNVKKKIYDLCSF
jgi:hypothetical protein